MGPKISQNICCSISSSVKPSVSLLRLKYNIPTKNSVAMCNIKLINIKTLPHTCYSNYIHDSKFLFRGQNIHNFWRKFHLFSRRS